MFDQVCETFTFPGKGLSMWVEVGASLKHKTSLEQECSSSYFFLNTFKKQGRYNSFFVIIYSNLSS